jgi:hypothetical protein
MNSYSAEDIAVCFISREGTPEMNHMISETLRGLCDRGYRIAGVHLEDENAALTKALRETCHYSIVHARPRGTNPIGKAREVIRLLLGGLREVVATVRSEDARAIVYMEGDKFTFVPCIDAMIAPILEDGADATLAVRSAQGFAQFPWVQRLVETGVNRYLSSTAGLRTDYLYGPRAFSPRAASLFEEYSRDDWGVIMYPLLAAIARGYRFQAVNVSGEPQPRYMLKYDAIMRSPPCHLAWRSIQNISIVRAAHAALRQ